MNRIQNGDSAWNLWHTEAEVRLEEEIALPDYCSDITRLLRLEVHPVVDRTRVSCQDSLIVLEVSGTAYFTALWLDETGEVCTYSFSKDFSESYKKDIGKGISIVSDSLCAEILPIQALSSPRAMSQRKLLSRCEIKLAVDVFANVSYVSYNALEDMEKGLVDARSSRVQVARVVAGKTEGFSLKEEIKLPSALPSASRVLSSSASVSIDSIHPSTDEATVFGTVNFKVFYLTDEEDGNSADSASFCQPIEFKSTVAIDDCAENSLCRVRAWTGNCSCEITTDTFGENRVFSLSVPYTLSCIVMENIETELIADVYGVGSEVEFESVSGEFLEYVGTLTDSTSIREELLLKGECERLEAVTGSLYPKGTVKGDDGYFVDMRLDISAISKKENRLDGGVREALDIRIPISLPDSILHTRSDSELVLDVLPSLDSLDAQVSRGNLEITGDVVLQVQVFCKKEMKYVKTAECKEKEREKSGIRFYYPAESDTLWSVGKRYGVMREKIKEANSIEDETLPAVVRIP